MEVFCGFEITPEFSKPEHERCGIGPVTVTGLLDADW